VTFLNDKPINLSGQIISYYLRPLSVFSCISFIAFSCKKYHPADQESLDWQGSAGYK
jgi:hypothetical protein